MGKVDDLTGKSYGLLTVVERLPELQDRYALYKCRCSCGRTLCVNSRSLKRGTVTGCEVCAPRRQSPSRIQSGDTFGDLTVVKLLAGNDQGNGCTWLCRCVCGAEVERSTKQLHSNQNRCRQNHQNSTFFVNLTGRQIHQLTVLEKLDKRDKKGSVMWRCICSCGKECEYSADSLLHGNVVSCGCYRRKLLNSETLMSGLHHTDGTCVEFLQRKKRSDNTSGYPGVSPLPNGRWKVNITFKKKRYYLGTYDDLADAIRARQRGEEMHDDFIEQYYKEHPEAVRKRVKTVAWMPLPELKKPYVRNKAEETKHS